MLRCAPVLLRSQLDAVVLLLLLLLLSTGAPAPAPVPACSEPQGDAALTAALAANSKVAVQDDGRYAYVPGQHQRGTTTSCSPELYYPARFALHPTCSHIRPPIACCASPLGAH